jgi:uncharacterized protein YjiK
VASCIELVFDNLRQVAKIGCDLRKKGDNCFLGKKKGKRGYEGVTYDKQQDAFHAVVEIEKSGSSGYCACIHTYDHGFDFLGEARLDYPFGRDDFKDDKGFEGLACLCQDGCTYLLALCEGNRCFLDDNGKESTGGVIQVYKREGNGWAQSRKISIPKTVRFKDYSGLDVRNGKVAVVSQEESKLWISTLGDDWTLDEGRIYLFPRNNKGKKKYCNVEGVAWITDTQMVVVSDSKKDRQAGRCKKKAQSIHVFEIPD